MLKSIISALLCLTAISNAAVAATKPNVLVIMADDQDIHLNSMDAMPKVKSLIADHGVTYSKHFCTVAWCCPSRVNFLTGRMAHNTNVTGLWAPYGGWPKFITQGLNNNWLPVWTNQSGIRNYYIGKLLNAYSVKNFDKPAHPRGFFKSSFLVDPHTYNYWRSHWTDGYTNRIVPKEGIHTTKVTTSKALHMIDDAADNGKQFFMMVTPVAPHVQIAKGNGTAPPPPPAWKGKFSNAIAPRTPDFNPDKPSGASWIYNLKKQNQGQIDRGDSIHRARLQNIAGIDDMVASLVDKLKDRKLLDNTYIIYTSDNGFHIGSHRMQAGKRCGYEPDINIPLLIRGPDVPQGVTTGVYGSHTDMAPTILKMLGVPLRGDFDGSPLAYTKDDIARTKNTEAIGVEFWDAVPKKKGHNYYDHTYKSLRLNTAGGSFYYSVWCNGEHEFYDMDDDKYQMKNLLRGDGGIDKVAEGVSKKYFNRPFKQLVHRLDALLLVVKACKGDSCRKPYDVLFPGNQVKDFAGAMDQKYDNFFANQPKVSFRSCQRGFIGQAEGPMKANGYKA